MEAVVHLRAPAVLRAWQATLVVGVAVLAISYSGLYSPGGTRLYETWIYEGLELLAALGCLARSVLVRAAWREAEELQVSTPLALEALLIRLRTELGTSAPVA